MIFKHTVSENFFQQILKEILIKTNNFQEKKIGT